MGVAAWQTLGLRQAPNPVPPAQRVSKEVWSAGRGRGRRITNSPPQEKVHLPIVTPPLLIELCIPENILERRPCSLALGSAPRLHSPAARTVLSSQSILIFIPHFQVGRWPVIRASGMCVGLAGPTPPLLLFSWGGEGPRERVCAGPSPPSDLPVLCPPQPAIATPWALLAKPATKPPASVPARTA